MTAEQREAERKEMGKRLKEARTKKKLTQAAVIDSTEIATVQTLSTYETGKNYPPIETLKDLSKLYDVTTDWLLFGNTSEVVPTVEKSPLEHFVYFVDEYFGEFGQYKASSAPCIGSDGELYYGRETVFPAIYFPQTENMDKFIQIWRNLRNLKGSGLDYVDYKYLIKKRIDEYSALIDKEIDLPF